MRTSKYAEEFDRMKDLLIELATEKNDRGTLKYSAPVIMKKIGHADDANAIDNFNRWLNRQGIYRKPRAKKETPAPTLEDLFSEAEKEAIQKPMTTEVKVEDALVALNVIAAAVKEIQRTLGSLAEAVGFIPVEGQVDTYHIV